jgi:pilus assembly protein CpaC
MLVFMLMILLTLGDKALALETHSLPVHSSELIKLSGPAAEVYIADASIADVQLTKPDQLFIFARRIGTTSLLVLDDKGQPLYKKSIEVVFNLKRLQAVIDNMAGPGVVRIIALPTGVVLEGMVDNATTLSNVVRVANNYMVKDATVINNLTVKSPAQVNLRVKIIEVQRTVTNSLGINWDSAFGDGKITFGTFSGARFLTASDASRRPFTLSGIATTPYQTVAGAARFTGGNFDLAALITALESEGLLSVLAEPNLTTISGQPASFLSGGELGVPLPGDPPSLLYKSYGVSLSFTPTVLSDNRINIKVKPEVSSPDFTNSFKLDANTTIPNIVTRRAETTVELSSGQSFVIAGLLQNSVNNQTQALPGLGDIPLLGRLFHSDSFSRADTEVIIIVTPYIVEPITHGKVPSPLDGLQHTSFGERNLSYNLTRATPPGMQVVNQDKEAQTKRAGFQVESGQ